MPRPRFLSKWVPGARVRCRVSGREGVVLEKFRTSVVKWRADDESPIGFRLDHTSNLEVLALPDAAEVSA